MDRDKKHIEKSFEEINSVLGELRRSIEGITKTLHDTRSEYEELRRNVDEIPNRVQGIVQQLVTQTLMNAIDTIGREVKRSIEEMKQRNTITTLILTRLATRREVPLEEILQIHPNEELVKQVLEELKNQETIRIIDKGKRKIVELVM